ncbi:hypothetical protein C4J81_00175 [Deltaproteobacteria bacterium Smac51]|nr:hypothetical protein C4J81_00175 [Deltaproteobacteria bacterium Smac51]
MFLPGSVPGGLVTEPGKNISPGGFMVSFLERWKVCLAERERKSGACFYPVSVTKTPATETG